MTPETLQQICLIAHDKAWTWSPHLTESMERYKIDTRLRIAAFLAHVMRDTDGFERIRVDLRGLTARRIHALWPEMFRTIEEAAQFAGSGVALCNRVFHACSGNEKDGDGYRYRPRGLLHLCGRSIYERASLALGHDFIDDPESLAIPHWAAFSGAWYWSDESFNYFADKGDLESITRILDRRALNEGRLDHRAVRVAFHEALTVLR